MYIGDLKVAGVTYTRPDSDIPFSPDCCEDGRAIWKWSTLYETCIDINVTLQEDCYIGALSADIISDSVRKIEVLVDGLVCHTRGGCALCGDTVFPVNAEGGRITVRIYTDVKNVSIGDITPLGMHEDGAPFVWPTPKSLELKDGFVSISGVNAAYDDADELAACRFLTARLAETFTEPFSDGGVPVTFIKLNSPDYEGERYTVDVSEDGIVITAASRIALIYGADALMQTDSLDGFPIMTIDDKPAYSFRGFHIGLPAKNQMEFTKRLLTYVLIPMRYNTLIVEFAGGMRFDKRPEITEAWLRADENEKKGLQPQMPHSGMVAERGVLEKDDVRELVEFTKELGIEFVPEVQSFGHVQWLTYAYPDVAELVDANSDVKDERVEDARPVGFYPHCYCPSNPKSYEIIFDVIDEIVEVTEPSFVHIGHDEIYHIGLCPRCRTRKSDDLYAEDVNKLYDYITAKGKKVMMWSDHLHDKKAHTKYTAPAIDRIPKDILMLDFTWYFHLDEDIETDLLDAGFRVVVGNLYSSHFPRYNSRMAREGMVGGQISCWVATNEKELADNGKFWDATLVGQMLWNPDAYDRRLLSCYSVIISSSIQPAMRDNIRGTFSPFGFYDARFEVSGGDAQPVPAAVADICPSAAVVKECTVDIDMNCSVLVFNHATVYPMPRIPWLPLEKVGTYTVTYHDGETTDIDIRYGAEVMRYDMAYAEPMPQQVYRHQGYVGTWYSDPAIQSKAADGSDITICGFVWDNPVPAKKIKSVSYRDADGATAGLILESINVVGVE